MESYIQNGAQSLADSLSFKVQPAGSYVVDRRSVSFFPTGGNEYTPNGVRVIKISLNGDPWLDPSTVKLFYTITNTTNIADPSIENPTEKKKPELYTNRLMPAASGPWIFFRRMRVMCGGQIIEDIDHYNRVHQMVDPMTPDNRRKNTFTEGFGPIDKTSGLYAIYKGSRKTVCFTPLSGLLNQEKFLPIRYCPIQLELELVSDPTDAVMAGNGFESKDFVINNVQLKCDLITLDNSLDNEYANRLLSGKPIPVPYCTFTCASQVITNWDVNMNIQRSFTRLKGIFLSLFKNKTENPGIKEAEYFFNPAQETAYGVLPGGTGYDKALQFQVQIGSKLYPEYPMASMPEQYYQLRKMLNKHIGEGMIDINYENYRDDRFIVAIDTEKIANGGAFSGISTKAGDLLTVRMKPQNGPINFDLDKTQNFSTFSITMQSWKYKIQESSFSSSKSMF